ncbi:unnamed protein product [Amoebophrya sp. A25]|nr:unnamed protein product [Amoebophrya sp. A25]|eukprot:GSA25T00013329001.1
MMRNQWCPLLRMHYVLVHVLAFVASLAASAEQAPYHDPRPLAPQKHKHTHNPRALQCQQFLRRSLYEQKLLGYSLLAATQISDEEYYAMRLSCASDPDPESRYVWAEMLFYPHDYINVHGETKNHFPRKYSVDDRIELEDEQLEVELPESNQDGTKPPRGASASRQPLIHPTIKQRMQSVFRRSPHPQFVHVTREDIYVSLCVPRVCAMEPQLITEIVLPRYLHMVFGGAQPLPWNLHHEAQRTINFDVVLKHWKQYEPNFVARYETLRRWELLAGVASTVEIDVQTTPRNKNDNADIVSASHIEHSLIDPVEACEIYRVLTSGSEHGPGEPESAGQGLDVLCPRFRDQRQHEEDTKSDSVSVTIATTTSAVRSAFREFSQKFFPTEASFRNFTRTAVRTARTSESPGVLEGRYPLNARKAHRMRKNLMSRREWAQMFEDPRLEDISRSMPSASCCSEVLQLQWLNFHDQPKAYSWEQQVVLPRVWTFEPSPAYSIARGTFIKDDDAVEAPNSKRAAAKAATTPPIQLRVLKDEAPPATSSSFQNVASATNFDASKFEWKKLKESLSPEALGCVTAFLNTWDGPLEVSDLASAEQTTGRMAVPTSKAERPQPEGTSEDKATAMDTKVKSSSNSSGAFVAEGEGDEDNEVGRPIGLRNYFGYPVATHYTRERGHGAIWQAIASPSDPFKRRFFSEQFHKCRDKKKGQNFLVRFVNMFTDSQSGDEWGWVDTAFGVCLPAPECTKRPAVLFRQEFPRELLLPIHLTRRFTVRIEPLLDWSDVDIDFVIIGFAKSGTTSLAFALHESVPGFEMAECDREEHCETMFWSHELSNYYAIPQTSLEYLLSGFTRDRKTTLRGAKDPRVIESEVTLRRLPQHAKIVILVSDPVDALLSHYNHMRCSELVDTDFDKMIAYNLTDCVPGRGWGSWRERIERATLIKGEENTLVIHMREALTVAGIARITHWLRTGEKSSSSSKNSKTSPGAYKPWEQLLASRLPEGRVQKRNVLGGGKAFLPFDAIPTATRQLANEYHAEERALLERVLAKHGSINGFSTRFDWWSATPSDSKDTENIAEKNDLSSNDDSFAAVV